MPQKSDTLALVERAKRYEHQALSGLCELYYRDVYSYIYYRGSNVQDTEDLTDDVFLKMVGSLGFSRVTVSESPTRWGCGAANPNKLGTPACYSCQFPKTQMVEGIRSCRAREEKSFLAWLFRIARNSVVDHRRRRAVRDHLPLDEAQLPTHSGPAAPVETKLTQERLRPGGTRVGDHAVHT